MYNDIIEIAKHVEITIKGLCTIVQNPDCITSETVTDDYANFINAYHYAEGLIQRKLQKIHDDVQDLCEEIR